MTIATDQAELDRTVLLINRLLDSGAQELSSGDGAATNSVRNIDYDKLCARRDLLERRIERAARGGVRVIGGTPL